jgi:hypothetical protein
MKSGRLRTRDQLGARRAATSGGDQLGSTEDSGGGGGVDRAPPKLSTCCMGMLSLGYVGPRRFEQGDRVRLESYE